MPDRKRLERILDRARWAPSGDNVQPWKFGILSDDRVVIYGADTRRTVVYDLQGHASQIAVGALLESVAIAASAEGLSLSIDRRPDPSEDENPEHPVFEIVFSESPNILSDPLSLFLETRCVNRRPFGTAPLTSEEKAVLEGCLPEGYSLHWMEGGRQRLRMADINQLSGKLRLTIPEAYAVHREIIEWNATVSLDRVPDRALGLPALSLPFMHWIMGSWERVTFFNRFLGGTLLPRLLLDLLPGFFCSAHFFLLAPTPPRRLDDYVAGGRALARFWLGCASLGLQFQPEMTPLIFGTYVGEGLSFSRAPHAQGLAERIAKKLISLGGDKVGRSVFLGRIGRGPLPVARSLRKPLASLLRA